MTDHYVDDVATGEGSTKLRIAGRPKEGSDESYVILEEPGEPVLMHWTGKLTPHFRRDCPNCTGAEETKPVHYLGAMTVGRRELVVLELTLPCFRSAAAAAHAIPDGTFAGVDLFGEPIAATGRFSGLMVKVSRAAGKASQRILRCDHRARVSGGWPYHTREELARIWGIAIRPRLFRADGRA